MKTKADVLSVLTTGSKSVHMYLKVGKETCNVSVRFDQGEAATICGYPQAWLLHDYPIDQFDSESSLGSEFAIDFEDGMLPQFKAYVGPEQEQIVLEAVIKGIKRQAKDPMFKDSATKEYRNQCIEACERRIKELAALEAA